jgi:bacteriocin-like protein
MVMIPDKKLERPIELSEEELEHVSGGALTSANPGGQDKGKSQITTNSGGNQPAGQNKDLPPGLRS